MNLLLPLLLSCGAGGVGVAAPPDSLGTAEVTAARRAAGLRTATPLQRLDSADILRRGITDMGDAMRRLAGVNLRDYGGAGGLKTVSVRGLGASHTTVTYDGLAVTDTRQGQIDLSRYSTDRLSALELHTLDFAELLCPVRNLGAAVVSLGVEAAAAADGRLRGSVALRQASFGAWHPSLSLSQGLGERTALGLSGDYFRARNDYPFVVENGVATTRLRRTNSEMQSGTAEMYFSHRLHQGTLSARAGFSRSNRDLPGAVTLYVNENDEHLIEQTAFAQARWSQRVGSWRFFAAAKFDHSRSLYDDYDAQYPNGVLSQHYRQQEAYATAGASLSLLPCLHAAYATDYAHATISSNLSTDRPARRDTWLQSLSLRLASGRWEATARALFHRYWNGRDGGSSAADERRLTPTLTASWLALRGNAELRLRGGYKESFRLPTFTESYFYHLGSPTLLPERTRQLSAGLTLHATPAGGSWQLSLTADAYVNRVRNRIISVPVSIFVWRTVNLGSVHAAGLDLSAQARWQPAPRHALTLAANYSLQRAADRTTRGSDTYGRQLAYTPLHSGAGSLSWDNPWCSLTAHVTYAAGRWSTLEHIRSTHLPPYAEWGFTAYRTFPLGRTRLTARADLVNAFNTRFEIIRRYPMPERAYKLSLQLNF